MRAELAEGNVGGTPIVAAVSVGIHKDKLVLDLEYSEDSTAEVDMNVVMTGSNQMIEVQGTAEGKTFSRQQMDGMMDLAEKGIESLVAEQRKILQNIWH